MGEAAGIIVGEAWRPGRISEGGRNHPNKSSQCPFTMGGGIEWRNVSTCDMSHAPSRAKGLSGFGDDRQ